MTPQQYGALVPPFDAETAAARVLDAARLRRTYATASKVRRPL